MGLNSTSINSVIGQSPASGAIAANIEITQEGLRSILSQIEGELQESEVYRRSMAGLQSMLGDAVTTAQILVKAIGREAVRLSFQQMARQYNLIPVDEGNTESSQMQPVLNESPQEMSMSNTAITPDPVTPAIAKPGKKLSKAELTAQIVEQQREDSLRHIGQALRQARLARSISPRQLHTQTLVPLHHLEALEAGRVDKLPEDIYIRGFVSRLAKELDLDAQSLLSSLPAPDPVKSVVPSWYRSQAQATSGFCLSPVHLYVGYTALVAGAMGGLALLSHQSPQTSVEMPPATPSQSSASEEVNELSSKPGLKSTQAGIVVSLDIAPPEATN